MPAGKTGREIKGHHQRREYSDDTTRYRHIHSLSSAEGASVSTAHALQMHDTSGQ